MRKNISTITLVGLFFVSIQLKAQIIVDTTATAAQMANTLVGNNGVSISNITSTCPTGSWGTFTTGATATSLGISSGIILSTGNAANAGQQGSFFSQTPNNAAGDSWLETYNVTSMGVTTHDACYLEFDAIPICDTIRFRYAFGSEEYPEWLNATNTSGFADAFAFFINGPGLPLGTNIAKIPVVNQPININTVNRGVFTCPGPTTGCTNCAYYINNCTGTSVVYDGITTVLTAQAIVQACSTYHIKLSIADGSDWSWDSGVFLEQGTLTCTGFTFNATSSNAMEGCQNGIIQVCHQLNPALPHTINFTIAGTAVNGVDYMLLNNSVTIPAGQTCTTLNVLPTVDGVIEPTENIYLIYQPNSCSPNDTVEIFIYDPVIIPPGSDITTCTGIPAQFGSPGLVVWNYAWSPSTGLNDTTLAQPTITMVNNTGVDIVQQYILTGTSGVCNDYDTIQVTVQPGPVANAGPDLTFCSGNSAIIGTAALPGNSYLWSPVSPNLSPQTGAQPTITSSNAGGAPVVSTYSVAVNGGLACLSYDTVKVTENPSTPCSLVLPFPPVCANAPAFALVGGSPLFGVYSGNGVSGGSFNPAVAGGGAHVITYTFTNGYNCVTTATATLNVYPLPVVTANAPSTVDICIGENVSLNATGSANITNWSWSPATFLTSSSIPNPIVTNPNPIGTFTYSLTVTDANTCVKTDVMNVNVHPLPLVNAGSDHSICIGSTYNMAASGASAYLWNPTTGIDNATIPNPLFSDVITTTYTVTGTDAFNCVNSDAVTIYVNPLPVMGFSTLPDLCIDAASLTLNEGTPVNGIYSGNGVSTGVFDAASAGQGTHTITYTYTNPVTQCSNVITQNITVNPLPNPAFSFAPSQATLANSLIHFTDLSPDAKDWIWDFGDKDSTLSDPNPSHTFQDTGKYTITMTAINQFGCKKSTSEVVFIGPDLLFFTPTAFSPNGDTQNDSFIGYGFGYYDFLMTIYDRWGNSIFQTKDKNIGWDGKDAQSGTYIYKINLKDFEGKPYEYFGQFSLLR